MIKLDKGYKYCIANSTTEEVEMELNSNQELINEWLNSVWSEECIKGEIKEYNELIKTDEYLREELKIRKS